MANPFPTSGLASGCSILGLRFADQRLLDGFLLPVLRVLGSFLAPWALNRDENRPQKRPAKTGSRVTTPFGRGEPQRTEI